MLKKIFPLTLILFVGLSTNLIAQDPVAKPKPSSSGPSYEPKAIKLQDSVLVTVLLKHQQDKNLPEIRRVLEAQGFWDMFPTRDSKIISWTIAIGLGHVIVLQVPANSVRRLNLAIQNGAWGAYTTEVYLSYDYRSIWEDYITKREEAKEDRN